MLQKLPIFATFSECKRLIHNQWQNKSLRPGQSLANKYQLPKPLEDSIYEETQIEKVIQKAWNYTNNRDYQNA